MGGTVGCLRTVSIRSSVLRRPREIAYPAGISCALFALTTLVGGCAPSGSPIVAGPAHFGVGWYVDRKPAAIETSQPANLVPLCVDVEGVGVLFSPNGCTLGY